MTKKVKTLLTRVRLVDADTWPHSVGSNPAIPPGTWANWRGQWVVLGPPRKREIADRWCEETDVVWPVAEKNNPKLYADLRITGERTQWVCRHQIQAGD